MIDLLTTIKGFTAIAPILKKFSSSPNEKTNSAIFNNLVKLIGNEKSAESVYNFMNDQGYTYKDIQRVSKRGYLKFNNQKMLIRITKNNKVDNRYKFGFRLFSVYLSLYSLCGLYPLFSQGKINWFYYLLIAIVAFFCPLLNLAHNERTYIIAKQMQEKLQTYEANLTKKSRFNKLFSQWK